MHSRNILDTIILRSLCNFIGWSYEGSIRQLEKYSTTWPDRRTASSESCKNIPLGYPTEYRMIPTEMISVRRIVARFVPRKLFYKFVGWFMSHFSRLHIFYTFVSVYLHFCMKQEKLHFFCKQLKLIAYKLNTSKVLSLMFSVHFFLCGTKFATL